MKIDIVYFVVLAFVVETLTEMIKKLAELDGKYTLIFAIILGVIFAILTTPEGLKYQLDWQEIPDWVSNVITGICIANFAKFYDYLYKYIKLKKD